MIIKEQIDSPRTTLRGSGTPLAFMHQHDNFCVWIDDHSGAGHEFEVDFIVTGHITPRHSRHLGSAMTPDGSYVLHAFWRWV